MNGRILVVDDDEDIRVLVRYNLEREGYEITEASNGKQAISNAIEVVPDLILLDVMMPEMDGMETCHQLRTIPELSNTMVCFLTARGEDYSQIAAFDAGADDYIVKPIRPKVLVSRIQAILRRRNTSQPGNTQSSSIILDKERYLITAEGKTIVLPRKEFELLALLMSKPAKVFHRDEIMSQVWGHEVIVGDRTIDVHIRKLREKIGTTLIHTIKGVGYKFEE